MRRRLAACALAAAAALSGVATTPSAATERSTPDADLRYVALGDSYSAASGVLPPDPGAPPQCLRSTANYPHVIAAATGAELTDVTCGGARTRDFFRPQHDGVPPQLRALRGEEDLVTMTIGGNDGGVFINSIIRCGQEGLRTLGQGSPCKDRYGASFERRIRQETYPALVRALRAVRAAAPDARVAILGYPWILPRTEGCFDRMPVARGDVAYLRRVQATLNGAVRRAAEAAGVTYVGMNRYSEGHDACRPIGVRWIEPVTQGTNAVVVHPNAVGERRMAQRTMAVLGLG